MDDIEETEMYNNSVEFSSHLWSPCGVSFSREGVLEGAEISET